MNLGYYVAPVSFCISRIQYIIVCILNFMQYHFYEKDFSLFYAKKNNIFKQKITYKSFIEYFDCVFFRAHPFIRVITHCKVCDIMQACFYS